MLVLASGGWTSGPDMMALISSMGVPQHWNDLGWKTRLVELRDGKDGLDDAVAWFDLTRSQTPGPVCVWGGSSGGNLALLLGSRRPVDCVVTEAAPTRLATITDANSLFAHTLIESTFAPADLPAFSPADLPVRVPVLMGYFTDDLVVPYEQGPLFDASHPDAKVVTLRPATDLDPRCDSVLRGANQCSFITHAEPGGKEIAISTMLTWRACEALLPSAPSNPLCLGR